MRPMGPRQIKATEIKAFIYAWCGQIKRKPEYTYETIGSFPRVTYKCTIQGILFIFAHYDVIIYDS